MRLAPLHFIEQGYQDARTAGPDWMAQRNRTTVYVELRWIKTQLSPYRYRLGRKCLVCLYKVKVGNLQPSLFQRTLGGRYRTHPHNARINARRRVAPDHCHWLQAKLFGLLTAHHNDSCSPIIETGRVASCDQTALGHKSWAQLGQSFNSCFRPWSLVLIKNGWTLLARHFYRYDLLLEYASFNRMGCSLLTLQCKLIEVFPAQFGGHADIFCRHPHMAIVESVP